MSNNINDENITPNSARNLRQQMRESVHDDLTIMMFQSFGKFIYQSGWDDDATKYLLDHLCENLGAAHGLIAVTSANTLTVKASRGNYYPLAARIPITGKLAEHLKGKAFNTHINTHPFWASSAIEGYNTFIIPICYKQITLGLLGFAKQPLQLSDKQLALCQAVCGLLAVYCQSLQTHQMPTADVSVLDKLTPREREVFALLPTGKSNAELGKTLGISGGTIKVHVERILNKLNLNDRTQAAVKAVSLGLYSD